MANECSPKCSNINNSSRCQASCWVLGTGPNGAGGATGDCACARADKSARTVVRNGRVTMRVQAGGNPVMEMFLSQEWSNILIDRESVLGPHAINAARVRKNLFWYSCI